MFDWMVEQGDDLAQNSTELVNLIDIKEKLEHWTAFKYQTSKALQMLERVQQNPPVVHTQHNSASTTELTMASAKPVKDISPAQIMTTLGIYHDRIMNEIDFELNHILHHLSVLQHALNKQSKLIASKNPPAALHIFGDTDITIKSLFRNINQFADKFGLPRIMLIAHQKEYERDVQKKILNKVKIGSKMSAEDIANIITTMTINYSLNNLKVFDMRRLIKAMNWNPELTSKLDPNQLLDRVLVFACNHTCDLHQQYLHMNEKRTNHNHG